MEKDEFETAFNKLNHRQSMRSFGREFGFLQKQEEMDRYEVLGVMGEAYEQLALGIHENVQAWSNGEGPLLQKVTTPTAYINGEVANTKTEYLLSGFNFDDREKQPEYVETYTKARDAVYEELLHDAIETGDYGPLLGVITTYKESTLARRLMNEMHAKKERYPDMIVGDAKRILGWINSVNQRIDGIQRSTKEYALDTAQKEFANHMRHEINAHDAGVIKAIALGIKIRFGKPRSGSKWARIILEERLTRIMKLPSVPEQLIEREKKGIPLAEDT